MLQYGLLSVFVEAKERAIHAELDAREDRELLDDLERLLIWEAIQETDESQLVGEPEPIVRAPTLPNLLEIRLGERRFTRELVFCLYIPPQPH